MSVATDCIKRVAAETDSILLFHSATGKDSIVMLDICAPFFKRIVCVYMYTVPNLASVGRYIKWAESRYSNCEFIQCPHFNVSSYIKYGFLGCTENPKQKLLNLVDITNKAREKTGIEWACFGMKEADSLNRRVFLRTYDDGINYKTKKFYPLHLYKHKDIENYIREKRLISPVLYGEEFGLKFTSSGECVDSVYWLYWLEQNFPQDLQQVYRYYPMTESLLFKFKQKIGE